MQLRTILLLLCLIAHSCAEVIKVKDCGSVHGRVNSVEVIPCRREPCRLRKERDYTIQVSFTSLVQSQTSKALAYAITSDGDHPIPVEEDACKSGLKCPIQESSTYLYKTTLNVPPYAPTIDCDVQWKLLDDGGDNLFCIQFPVKIVN